MTLEEYIKKAKTELDQFELNYKKEHEIDPENWPMDMNEGEWVDQEMFYRF